MPLKRIPVLLLLLAAVTAVDASAQGLPPIASGDAGADAVPGTGPSAYDVASVHEHPGDDHMMRWMNKPNGFATVNIPLQSLIASAYNIKMDLISGGPSWVNTKGFDIEAKVLPGDAAQQPKLSPAQQRVLLRALLVDRFHLAAHMEPKVLPVYDLTVAKGGPKMPVVPPQPPSPEQKSGEGKPGDLTERGSMSFAPGNLQAHAFKMSNFVENLGYIVQRTVHDKTGLTGEYNIDLSWTPEEQLQAAGDNGTTAADQKPSIYAALQEQLGLKLIPTKGPVDTLVIDHIELPTAN